MQKRINFYWKLEIIDHCHFTCKCKTAAHIRCNSRWKNSYLSVIAHNLLGYDNHLIITKVAEKFKDCSFLLIFENTNKYILFSLREEFEIKMRVE